MRRRVLIPIVVCLVAAPTLGAETARQILDRRKALDDTARHWVDRRQTLKFRIVDRHGGVRTRDLELAEKRYPDDERKAIVFFLSPPEVKGTSFLAFTHKGKPADQWLYLPELERVRQITANTRTQSFVGTDLTYRDLDILTEMASWTEADATSSLRGEETVDGVPCHVIDLAPKRDDIGYAKIVLWLGRDDLVPRRLEFFGDEPEAAKRIEQRDIRNVGAIPVAYDTKVETLAAGSSTEITVVDTKFNQNLSDDAFSQRALEQGPQ
ncbi:MAG TPA: outer membrane lipoprotein-sorting protein [Gaiellaceae bacterium]|nr:outer membrane lipoprotein-sorting protein [Gaiellaceae bacterium]